jgi:transcriptional regulator with XRE-family HTH domain
LTNTTKLRELIKNSGLKKKYIAEKLGITTYGLQKKIDNKSEFKSTEIVTLCKLLHINSLSEKEEIFFVLKVD